jgi:subtilisin-like proprotein convertase family protein
MYKPVALLGIMLMAILISCGDENDESDWIYGENIVPLIIHDSVTTSSAIAITGAPSAALVDSVKITVSITHGDFSDLTIRLIAPDLVTNLIIWDGDYPGGTQEYTTDLFAGTRANGMWTLHVWDGVTGNQGWLEWWNISILWSP